MRRIWDITPAISDELAVWPGDTPPTREVLLDLERGDNITLSTLRTTVHLGAHTDAPSHYGKGAPTIDEMQLARYLGPCTVVRPVGLQPGERIAPSTLDTDALADERILLATDSYPDPTRFNRDFNALSVELVHALADRGVRLIGIDTPSVDLSESKDLPAHAACLDRDVAILEGIRLGDVPDGRYELIALPLPLVGFDASPVRAVLREI